MEMASKYTIFSGDSVDNEWKKMLFMSNIVVTFFLTQWFQLRQDPFSQDYLCVQTKQH